MREKILAVLQDVGLDFLVFGLVSATYVGFSWVLVSFGPAAASEALSVVLLSRMLIRRMEKQMRGEEE